MKKIIVFTASLILMVVFRNADAYKVLKGGGGKSPVAQEQSGKTEVIKGINIPLDKAIKIGDGSTTIIEFTDPDCPYCRRASAYLSAKNDITRYVFFYPLKMHPQAKDKVLYILSADDRVTAYHDVMSGKLDLGGFITPGNVRAADLLQTHITIAERLGVKGTPVFYVNRQEVRGFNAQLIEQYASGTEVSPRPAAQTTPPAASRATVKSDVDELPAVKTKTKSGAYAIVIGIERYRQKLPAADFAVNDAQTMSEYLTKVLGYPEENVVTLTNENASLGDFVKYFEQWLPNHVEKDNDVFIYYSGHGAPNPKTGDAFLVPYDGDPSFINQTGYSLKRLYDSLGRLPAKEIIVVLDACFSGAGGKSVLAKGARPLVMNLEQAAFGPKKNTIVMSAAAGDQISSTYDGKNHGLFTYFLLKGVKGEADLNEDGKIEIGELYVYLKPRVEKTARTDYNNEQTPQLIIPASLMRSILRQN